MSKITMATAPVAVGSRVIDIRAPRLGSLTARIVTDDHVIADFPLGGPLLGGSLGSARRNWAVVPAGFREPPPPWTGAVDRLSQQCGLYSLNELQAALEADAEPEFLLAKYRAAAKYLDWVSVSLAVLPPEHYQHHLGVAAEAARHARQALRASQAALWQPAEADASRKTAP